MGIVRSRRVELDEATLGRGLIGDEPRIAKLADLMKGWLAAPSLWLAFPALLEQQFETDWECARRRSFRLVTLLCLTAYLSYLPIYCHLLPDEAIRFVEAQLGVAMPVSLLSVWLIRRPRSRLVRELAFSVVGVTCLSATIWAYQPSVAPIAPSLRDAPAYALLYCNLILGLRFPFAAATTSLMVASSIADCTMLPGVSFDFRLHALSTTVIMGLFTLLGNYRLEREARRSYLLSLGEQMRARKLGDLNERLKALSMLDPLTGLSNRRAFDVALEEAWNSASKAGGQIEHEFGVLVVDVDRFKCYNDAHGHPAGDACLRLVAGALHAEARLDHDTVARYGGEEFAAVIPGAGEAQCVALAERMRVAVEELALPHHGFPGQPIVTVSIGVATVRPTSPVAHGVLEAADAALYKAKNTGRNRVVSAASPLEAGALHSSEPADFHIRSERPS